MVSFMLKPRIKMSVMGPSYHLNPDHHIEAQYDWAEGTFLQGGDKGLVISTSSDRGSYTTTFIEAFPPENAGGGFFRGEGPTVAEAETKAWEKYQSSVQCPGHEWTARGYTNGAGFCIHCNKFGSEVFTGEQLGQFCHFCGEGTFYAQIKDSDEVEHWYCKEDSVPARTIRFELLELREEDGALDEAQTRELSQIRFLLGRTDDV